MSTDPWHFVDAAEVDAGLTRRFYREVMAECFGPDELIAEDALVDGVADAGSGLVGIIAVEADGIPRAGFVAEWFAGARVLRLRYLAVQPGLRRQGIGSRLAQVAVPSWTQRFDPLLMLGEVEDPRFFDPGRHFGDGWARLRLYGRFSGRVVALDYVQPALRPGRERVEHLLLMSFFTNPGALVAPGVLDGAVLEPFLRAYFERCGDSTEDPQAAELLAACRTPEGLRLVAPFDYVGPPPP